MAFAGLDPTNPQYSLSRAAAYMRDREYAAALRDFDIASTKETHSPSPATHLQIARCRLLIGSLPTALLAVHAALALAPSDEHALALQGRVRVLQGRMAAYEAAVGRGHWRTARTAYEACLAAYAREDSDAPLVPVRCWGVALLVVECAWEDAGKTVECVLYLA